MENRTNAKTSKISVSMLHLSQIGCKKRDGCSIIGTPRRNAVSGKHRLILGAMVGGVLKLPRPPYLRKG
jgi:hypothetical protein